jgi:hypothetical protein
MVELEGYERVPFAYFSLTDCRHPSLHIHLWWWLNLAGEHNGLTAMTDVMVDLALRK